MGLREMLKKKNELGRGGDSHAETLGRLQAGPEFTFIRSDTHTQEIIQPPTTPAGYHFSGGGDYLSAQPGGGGSPGGGSRSRRSLDVFRPSSRSRNSSVSSSVGGSDEGATSRPRRLSQRLHLSRDKPTRSDFVPDNLPQIAVASSDEAGRQWQNRATMLASANEHQRRLDGSRPGSAAGDTEFAELVTVRVQDENGGDVSHKQVDADIQEAIRLHESGDPDQLVQSTAMFQRLADPRGPNNPLSQVMYGLALRHGWGVEPNFNRAVSYLSVAASNAANIVNQGGNAKGDLVLAIYELANSFRDGCKEQKIPPDPVAAKQYFETAANLGDSDAMNETAACYLNGFGCKKDKFAAARYYRLAEDNGNKTLGNSWIWKEKYNPQ